MSQQYSQVKALFAIAKSSFIALLRSPSAVAFTVGFPLVFVLVFGFIGGRHQTLKVGVSSSVDTTSPIYRALDKKAVIQFITHRSKEKMNKDLQKGRIASIIDIEPIKGPKGQGHPHYKIVLYSSGATVEKVDLLESVLHDVINHLNSKILPHHPTVATVHTVKKPGRIFRQIDFILPGMLGFSLLSTGVFGTAFLFFSLRQTLVLKRFFTTPIKKSNILLGEALARLVFQLLGALLLIAIGCYFFNLTLVHGILTVLELLILSAFGLIIFMGFGFIISSIAKNESTIPAVSNVIVLPQFMLAGTFFPIDVLPHWLQPICKILPLTFLNEALRKVSFEGVHLWQLPKELLFLTLWGILIYAVATKVFRWE